MNEWNEHKLDQELEALMKEMPEQEELEKRISQSINRRIRRIVFRTLTGCVAVLAAAFLVINPLMNLAFLNPHELNQEPEQKMLGVLRDYIETTRPYREMISLHVKKKGFARYELEMQVADLTEPLAVGISNVWCEINQGRYENFRDAAANLTQIMGRFTCGEEEQQEMTDRIRELPESAVIYLSVSDTSPKPVEELRRSAVELEWFQVYQPEVEFQGGLSVHPRAAYDQEDVREEMTEQELLEVYLANLKNLLDYREVWSELGLSDGRGTVFYDTEKTLSETYEDARGLTALESENYCVYGKRDAVLQFLEEDTLDSILVEKVRLW